MKNQASLIVSTVVLLALCIALALTTLTYQHKANAYHETIHKQEVQIQNQKKAINSYEKLIKESGIPTN